MRWRKDFLLLRPYKSNMKDRPPEERDLDLQIDQLLRRWPAAAQALIKQNMACVGCSFDRFHTLDQALEIYSVDPEGFLEQLRILVRQEDSAVKRNDSLRGDENA